MNQSKLLTNHPIFNSAIVISTITYMKAKKHFSFDKARNLLTKTDIWTIENIFKKLKSLYLHPISTSSEFVQYVLRSCLVETSCGK